jgi:hypothetical protein
VFFSFDLVGQMQALMRHAATSDYTRLTAATDRDIGANGISHSIFRQAYKRTTPVIADLLPLAWTAAPQFNTTLRALNPALPYMVLVPNTIGDFLRALWLELEFKCDADADWDALPGLANAFIHRIELHLLGKSLADLDARYLHMRHYVNSCKDQHSQLQNTCLRSNESKSTRRVCFALPLDFAENIA